MMKVEKRIAERVRRIEITTRRLSDDALHGGIHSRFRGRGMDFDEVREYAPGDDVRAIDWNATARTGRVFVKKYREERQLTVVFVVDMSASGALGAGEGTKRDQAVEIAGVLALAAVRSDHRVGAVAFAEGVERFVAPARGRAHSLHLVRELTSLTPATGGTNLSGALRFVRERLKRRAVVVVLSDFLVGQRELDASASELRLLARRHDVIGIKIGDPLDVALPEVGLLTVEDAETGEVVELDTGSRRTRAALAQAVRDSDERVRRMTRTSRVDLLEVDTVAPWLSPLVGFFRSRGVRT